MSWVRVLCDCGWSCSAATCCDSLRFVDHDLERAVVTSDIETNFEVARVLLRAFPVAAPNGYLVAEAIMILDSMHDGKIMQNSSVQALLMSSMLKVIVAAVRKQWRDRNAGTSRSAKVLRGEMNVLGY